MQTVLRARGSILVISETLCSACLLLRGGDAAVRFTEINLFGVYVAPMSLMMVTAWGHNRIAARRRPVRPAAPCLAPAMFVFAVYMVVLSTIILTVAAR
jgi:hypothetical protein